MKRIIYFFIFIIILSCGKKELPPSPDIFAPSLKSILYYENNTIKILFNESVLGTIDSLRINIEDSIIYPNYIIEDNGIIVSSIKYKIKYIDIFGIMDKNENKRDFLNLKLKGKPIEDTIKPFVERFFANDTIIMIYCNELINNYNVEVYPSYLTLKDTLKNKTIIVHIRDTLGSYKIQFIVNNLIDFNNNVNNKPFIAYAGKIDSFHNYNIEINLTNTMDSLYLYDYDGFKIRKAYNFGKKIIFENLKKGKYFIYINNTKKEYIVK